MEYLKFLTTPAGLTNGDKESFFYALATNNIKPNKNDIESNDDLKKIYNRNNNNNINYNDDDDDDDDDKRLRFHNQKGVLRPL